MANESNTPADWAAAMQKAQADMLLHWTDMTQTWVGSGKTDTGTASAASAASPAGAASSAAAGSAIPADVARQFLQQCEHYMGVSRSLWDLVTRSAATADGEQRARTFNDGLAGLQQQFAGLWATTPFAAPPATGFALPALGPTRTQQEALQRLTQLGTRCAQAQGQVTGQWNDIIGKSLRAWGERLAPQLKSGAAPESMKEIYDLWVDSAENVYAQAARGAAFVQAQAELTNSMSQLRTAQRELFEEWAKQFDLPTRAELNSIHQQLRDLKAALAGMRG